MALGMEVGLGPGHIVLDYIITLHYYYVITQLPPQFSAHFCCGQTAACIRKPLGMEAGFSSLCDIVLDGNPAPPP